MVGISGRGYIRHPLTALPSIPNTSAVSKERLLAPVLFQPDEHVYCPHCRVMVCLVGIRMYPHSSKSPFGFSNGCRIESHEQVVMINAAACPACHKVIVQVVDGEQSRLVVPRNGTRRPIHPTVPSELRESYEEAVLVVDTSPKASAALARRCLQTLLVFRGAKKSDLVDQLAEVYTTLPGYVQTFVDNIRKLGNLAAHAKTSKSTGEIVPVEPSEAEWMLELLEELFDHYYAKPAEAATRQAALTAKFADAGRLKSTQ